ncbi:MAG: two-component system, OmpR family, alkaline phosphatase synthesis response regulator PhoP [Verrucomicrobiota bacterium]
MPATTSGIERSILLIEEYHALAVAIESALKKFAPQHRTHVARSLAEARTVAHAQKPELIILDFDPPHSGAIGFFEEIQSVLPDSRVLVIAAGTSPELVAERGANGALQFLEKPFELVDFGAAVQALLGPWMETGTSRGTLRDLALVDAASLACLAGNNAMLQVHAPEERDGQLHIQKGRLVHAITGEAEGENALIDLLQWKEVRFVETAGPAGIPKTLRGPWAATLVEALRETKKRAAALRELVPAKPQVPAPAAPPAKTGPKILVIDDTEMLLIFVEDSLTLADPSFQITTALTGLHGVKEAERIRPDLILVDYSLPDIKGDEVCRRIGANESTQSIPIVMMSGHVHEMTTAAEKLPNVVATIAKPFLSDAMVALVRQTLKEGRRHNLSAGSPAQKKSPGAAPEKERARATEKETSPSVAQPKTETPPAPTAAQLSGETLATPKRAFPPPGSAGRPHAAPVSPSPGMPEMMQPQFSIPLPRPQPRIQERVPPDAPVLAPNEVLLDLPLDVISMQFDSFFQIGSIRARPASAMVAIEIPALAARSALPLETGFHLGPVDLDRTGRISIVRLLPTTQPFRVMATGSAFEIGGMTVVPANQRERLQLVSTSAPNMALQLFAPLELESVEFSATLDVKQLVLRCRGKAVRVTLNSQSSSIRTGASFHTTAVKLDDTKRIRELTLAPVG